MRSIDRTPADDAAKYAVALEAERNRLWGVVEDLEVQRDELLIQRESYLRSGVKGAHLAEMEADRDRYKQQAEELATALEAITNEEPVGFLRENFWRCQKIAKIALANFREQKGEGA